MKIVALGSSREYSVHVGIIYELLVGKHYYLIVLINHHKWGKVKPCHTMRVILYMIAESSECESCCCQD